MDEKNIGRTGQFSLDIGSKDGFDKTASYCAMGDLRAMIVMFKHFRRNLSEEYLHLEQELYQRGHEMAYEELMAALSKFFEVHDQDGQNFRMANFWLNRAEIYGSEEARQILYAYPFYRDCFFGRDFFLPNQDMGTLYDGSVLRKMGLGFFSSGETYSITSPDKDGIYTAETYAGYEGPDETGFGMEEEYNFYYFDEFFQLLLYKEGWSRHDVRNNKERIHSECQEAMFEKRRERERFWESVEGSKEHERYHAGITDLHGMMDDGVVLEKYLDSPGPGGERKVTVPSGIRKIAPYAFRNCTALEEVILPENLEEIGVGAFSGCRNLRMIMLPAGIKEISAKTFFDCRHLEKIGTSGPIREIGESAFEFTLELKSINLSDGLTAVRRNAFNYSGISRISLPETVCEIEKNAFGNCGKLTAVRLPRSLEAVEDEAFCNCHKLQKVLIMSGNAKFGEKLFCYCESLKKVVLPEGMKTIPWGMFEKCRSLRHVSLPDSLEDISINAFANTSLVKVVIPKNVSEIWMGAFECCNQLRDVILPKGLKKIRYRAFYGCKSLKRITVSKETLIENNAFEECCVEIVRV